MSLPQQIHAVTGGAVWRDRFIRLPEAIRLSGVGKSTLYALMARNEFPQCIQITPRCVGWSEQAVLQWVQRRIAAAQRPPADLAAQGPQQ